jgi:hypothetical protein
MSYCPICEGQKESWMSICIYCRIRLTGEKQPNISHEMFPVILIEVSL